jgi:outer membrane protein assembly factor BamE
MRTLHPILMLAAVSVTQAGCVHRVDINQGNIVTQEMINQLRPGMNRRQVTYLLGTPLLTDPFHDNRWDYVYSIEPNGEPRQEKRVMLVFDRDALIKLEGDFRPGAKPDFETGKDATILIPKIDREKTLWEKVKSLFGGGD